MSNAALKIEENQEPSTELVPINSLVPSQVFKEGGADPILDEIENQVRSGVYDISTAKGRDEIKSVAYKIARSKTALDNMGKALGEEALRTKQAIDSERRKVRERLDALKDEIRKPLTEFEEREKNRIAGHEQAISDIRDAVNFDVPDPDVETISARIESMEKRCRREWEEFSQRGADAYKASKEKLTQMLDARKKRDAEQAELERLRREQEERERLEREERMKQEAADKARREAEEKAKKEAEESARRAAEEKEAALKAERERVEREKREQEELAAKREADKNHKAKINNGALSCLTEKCGLDDDQANSVVAAIARGEIKHVKIFY